MNSQEEVLATIENDLRTCFFEEWKFGAVVPDRPHFRPIAEIIQRAFSPFKEIEGYHYSFFIAGRYCKKDSDKFTARRITSLFDATAGVSSARPAKISFSLSIPTGPDNPNPEESRIPCSKCHGLGVNGAFQTKEGGVPSQIIEMHPAMVEALRAPFFNPIRSHRWRIMVSILQTGEDTGVALPDPGIYQILFGGKVYGFGAKPAHRPAAMHYLDAWNLTVNPYFYHEEEDAPVQKLGIDPNNPNEYIEHPWRKPCEVCLGQGSLPKK